MDALKNPVGWFYIQLIDLDRAGTKSLPRRLGERQRAA